MDNYEERIKHYIYIYIYINIFIYAYIYICIYTLVMSMLLLIMPRMYKPMNSQNLASSDAPLRHKLCLNLFLAPHVSFVVIQEDSS